MEFRLPKIIFLLVLCVLMMAQTVFAEKIDYKDPNFNFKTIKNIAVYDMSFEAVDLNNDILERSLNTTYVNTASKEKLPVMSYSTLLRKMSLTIGTDMDLLAENNYEEFNRIYKMHLSKVVDAWVEADVIEYKSDSIYHPPYTTWERRTESTHVYDNWGNRVRVDEEILVPVEHPGYYETVFYETVEFHVFDAKTGREVFSRQEIRSRSDDDGRGMFGRICSSFFKDLRKMIK